MNHTSKVMQEITQRINELCEKITLRDVQIIDLTVERDNFRSMYENSMAMNAGLLKEHNDLKGTIAELAHHPQPVMPMLSKAEIHANTALNSLLLREDLISANRLLAGHKDDIDLIIERAKDIGARMAATN